MEFKSRMTLQMHPIGILIGIILNIYRLIWALYIFEKKIFFSPRNMECLSPFSQVFLRLIKIDMTFIN